MSVTLHTRLGDLKIEVFCESVPKTAEVQVDHSCCHKLHCLYLIANSVAELSCPLRIQLLR